VTPHSLRDLRPAVRALMIIRVNPSSSMKIRGSIFLSLPSNASGLLFKGSLATFI